MDVTLFYSVRALARNEKHPAFSKELGKKAKAEGLCTRRRHVQRSWDSGGRCDI